VQALGIPDQGITPSLRNQLNIGFTYANEEINEKIGNELAVVKGVQVWNGQPYVHYEE
jgi:hypothetical protein